MIRLFAAIELPPQVRQRLALMGGGIPGARWVAPENLHLTVRFIGDMDAHGADQVHEALSHVWIKPFDVTLKDLAAFGERRPRILYTGVATNPALHDVYERINAALARAGLPPPDERRYVPHVTLARLGRSPPERIGAFIVANNILTVPPILVEKFALMSSHRSPAGASYQVEARYPLD